MTPDATRLAQAWAANQLPVIRALETRAAVTLWVCNTMLPMADCARHAPETAEMVRKALRERDDELKAATIRDGVG